MKVFVTGGTGFVGMHVVDALQAGGHAVRCLVRDPTRARVLFAEPLPELVPGDLDDRDALVRGCAGADAVVHLAGLTAARSRAELFHVNAGGTVALVEALRAAAPELRRYLHVSSLAAAGPADGGAVPELGDEAQPVSDYGRSKLAGEAPVRGLDLPWTILRPPAVYGPRDREFLRLFRAARYGVSPLFGDGSQRLSLVFAHDLADAVVRCLDAESTAGGVYYPAHSVPTTARALVLGIGAALGTRVRILPLPRGVVRPLFWLTGTAARTTGRATLLSADKANEILADAWLCSPAPLAAKTGWRARTDLVDGLRRTAAWYRTVGWI